MVSVSVFALMELLPETQFPVPGLNVPVASDGSPLQVKVSGRALGLKLFAGVTVRLTVAGCPAGTE
jgi:hypothetical protein